MAPIILPTAVHPKNQAPIYKYGVLQQKLHLIYLFSLCHCYHFWYLLAFRLFCGYHYVIYACVILYLQNMTSNQPCCLYSMDFEITVGVLTVIVKINKTNTIFNRATKPFIVMMAEHIC
jgi:hypothetical protein